MGFLKGKRAGSSKRQDSESGKNLYSFSFYPHSSVTKLEIEFLFLRDNIEENFRKGYNFLRKKKQQKGVYFSAVAFRPQRYMKTSCKVAAKAEAGIGCAAVPRKEMVQTFNSHQAFDFSKHCHTTWVSILSKA